MDVIQIFLLSTNLKLYFSSKFYVFLDFSNLLKESHFHLLHFLFSFFFWGKIFHGIVEPFRRGQKNKNNVNFIQ